MKSSKEIMAANIQRNMRRLGLSRKELSQALNVPYTTVTDWIHARTYPRIDKIERMANYFGVEKADLVEDPDAHTLAQPTCQIPTYDSVPGTWNTRIPLERKMTGNIVSDVPVLTDLSNRNMTASSVPTVFEITVSDDSMNHARILEGDTVLIRSQSDIKDGQIAAVSVDDEIMLRRVYRDDDRITLTADNPACPPQIFQGEDLARIHILGEAIRLISDII